MSSDLMVRTFTVFEDDRPPVKSAGGPIDCRGGYARFPVLSVTIRRPEVILIASTGLVLLKAS